jgi:pyruvate,water dikinase
MPTTHIVEFSDPRALDPSVVGSKTASIVDLIRNGVTVPPGFSIHASAFNEFTRPVATKITKILESVTVDDASSSFDASDSINELLVSLNLPDGLAIQVAERIDSNAGTSAVRSSATVEDLEGASFAGMYDSFLDAVDAEFVLRRVRDVWASYYTGRAISYRQRMGIPHESGSMAVLVMELVHADAGGVVFTRDPRDGTDQILVNAALGLGEGVVSGKAEADSFTLSSGSFEITRRDILDKERMLVSGKSGSTNRVPVPAAKRSQPALSDAQLVAVAKAASSIKKAAGNDRDIEFAVKDDTVHILQSRPVTTGTQADSKFPVEWDNPADAELHWMPAFTHTARNNKPTLPLHIDYRLIAGVSEQRSIDYAASPQARRYLKKIVNGYMYTAEPPHDEQEWKARVSAHERKAFRYLKKGTSYYHEVIEPRLRERLAELERDRPDVRDPLPELIANLRATKQTAADHQSDLHWRGGRGFGDEGALLKMFGEITGRPEVDAAGLTRGLDHMTSRLVARLISLAALVKSDPWLSDVFEKRNYDAIFAHGAGKRPAVHRFRTRFSRMLETWGRRNGIGYGSAWTPIDPTWNMKPEIPLDSIGSYVRQDLDALTRARRDSKRTRKALIRLVCNKIGTDGKLRKQFDFELFRAAQKTEFMENHNYLIEQCTFGEYRESIHRLGVALTRDGWTDEPDDVFFLRLAQLESAASEGEYSRLHTLVIQAKAEFAENTKLSTPEYLGTKPPDDQADEPAGDSDRPPRGLSEDKSTLHGEPSSPGVSTGTARVVISRSSRPPDVKQGDILVTDNAGPDWVPVFPLLGGLILDGGANFQHASLICREYGIPCVIQTKEATKIIADGQLVSVDGSTGKVHLNPVV